MEISVLTPDETIFEGEVSAVKVPGANGSFEVLVNHAPIVSSLTKGEVSLKKADGEQTFQIGGGFIEVLNNKISLLVQGVQQ